MPAIVKHTIFHQFNNSLLEKKNITFLDEHLDDQICAKSKTLNVKGGKKFILKIQETWQQREFLLVQQLQSHQENGRVRGRHRPRDGEGRPCPQGQAGSQKDGGYVLDWAEASWAVEGSQQLWDKHGQRGGGQGRRARNWPGWACNVGKGTSSEQRLRSTRGAKAPT